jgi:schlafen family protein
MTENEFVQLLYRGESESLDFKREQYVFVGASEEAKGELLKDILAFANAWRNDLAYILIGVQETPSRKANVTGISPADHIDDATLQQFVNTKTNHPVRFAYERFEYDDRHVGIVRIDHPQARPIFLGKGYGLLKAQAVYIRRGSSTDIAGPEEIAAMGRSDVRASEIPQLEIEFAEPGDRRRLGREPTATAAHLRVLDSARPATGASQPAAQETPDATQYEWRLQRARDTASRARFAPLGLWVANNGSVTAHDARVVINIAKADGLRIVERREVQLRSRFNPLNLRLAGDFLVAQLRDCWELKLDVGKVQPKSQHFVPAVFFVDVRHAVETQVSVSVFADNLPEPITLTTVLRVLVEESDVTLEEIEEALKGSEE